MAASRILWALWVALAGQGDRRQPLPGLTSEAVIVLDRYALPHIHARTWPDAARVLGYLHAGSRLAQMEVFRRQASGTISELLGAEGLKSDVLMRQIGVRRHCEALWNSDRLPEEFREELTAYSEGVNARLKELGDNPPLLLKAMGVKPAPWTPVDSLVFAKYMGWDQSGTMDDLWFGAMAEKLGPEIFEELWPVDRPYEIPTIEKPTSLSVAGKAKLQPIPGCAEAYLSAWNRTKDYRLEGPRQNYGSNNWAVSGAKTASGKPILCSDPHLDLRLPAIWYAVRLSVGGKNLAGVTFPGGPTIVIGHSDRHAWGITNLQADAVDFYVEAVDPKDPLRYKHRGEWKKMDRIGEEIKVRDQPSVTLFVDNTVHGPVISRDGKTISMAWTGLGMTTDPIGIWRMGRAQNLQEFISALELIEAPGLCICYADAEGNIAMRATGSYPVRAKGGGRIPMDGASGDHDWKERVRQSQMPLAVNPDSNFVASANNVPAPSTYPNYLGWMWDASYRKRRINALLTPAANLDAERISAVQLDAHDFAAEQFVPILVSALKKQPPADPVAAQAAQLLAAWNYDCTPDSAAATIWVRWFPLFRDHVWQDEWKSRNITTPDGSWGFSGTNRREPEIEVLEQLTREKPDSPWFDDKSTPHKEDRDAILLRSFAAAIEQLKGQHGADVAKWRWGELNRLTLPSLFGQSMLNRKGAPVSGSPFTVNPGGGGGGVSSGASWRMIVDFGKPSESIGVYPGGQTENPLDPHYADLMLLWQSGRYAPLQALASVEAVASDEKARKTTFTPAR